MEKSKNKKSKQFVSTIGEFGVIDIIRKQLSGMTTATKQKKSSKAYGPERFLVRGVGDDAAVIRLNKQKHMLLTTDMIGEGVHFTSDTSPKDIGVKAMMVNISDIVAMGGVPQYALVTLGLPRHKESTFVKRLYEGMMEAARHYNVIIVGGDIVKNNKVFVNVALVGEVFKKDLITRSGAKNGDSIYVTGPLGCSFKTGWHLKFRPRFVEVQYLLQRFRPTAMIDISDGLAGDLKHILDESRVGAELYAEKIPLRKGAKLDNALHDGEDFEILFTLSWNNAERMIRQRKARFSFFPIGTINKKEGTITLIQSNQIPTLIKPSGYTHF